MHDDSQPDHTPAPPTALPPPDAPKSRWSWWWIFPALLFAYIAYSAIPYLPFVKPKPNADALLTQSLAAAQAGRYQECIDAAQQAIKLQPTPEAYNNIGWCNAQMGKWNEGIQNVMQALKLKPDMERAKNNLLWMVSQRNGNPPVSATPVQPPAAPIRNPADAAMQRSLEHAQAHRYQECIDSAREALKFNPNYPEAYNNLGYCSGGLGKWEEATHYLNEALRLRPDFQLAKGNLAWIASERAKAGGR